MSSLLLFLAACGGSDAPSVASPAAAPAASSNSLTIKGSDSEVNVVQQLAEAFMKDHPGVSVSVSGGGSGTGIALPVLGATFAPATTVVPTSRPSGARM